MIRRRHVAAAAVAIGVAIGAAIGVGVLSADDRRPRYDLPGASASRGRSAIERYGCGSCHTIPGVRDARALVGPPLTRWGERVYVAGLLPNDPPHLVRWIMHPQSVVPGNAMPELGIAEPTARDIAQYLYGLR